MLASRGVLQAMSVIAHLLAPLVAASVTPATIVVVLFAFDWRMGLAAVAAAPVVVAIQIRAGRSTAATDAERHEREQDATGRVIEYSRRSRCCGRAAGPSRGSGRSTIRCAGCGGRRGVRRWRRCPASWA